MKYPDLINRDGVGLMEFKKMIEGSKYACIEICTSHKHTLDRNTHVDMPVCLCVLNRDYLLVRFESQEQNKMSCL